MGAGPSMSPCGTLSIKRRRSRSVRRSTRSNAPRESSDSASRPPDRNATPSMRSSATLFIRTCASRSTELSTSLIRSLNAQLNTSKIQFEWRGHGNDKVWAPIEGTCQNVPYDECKEVPEQKCVSVPKQVCITVPDQVCTNEPLTECIA